LVLTLGREFERSDTGYDWAASGATAQQRLRRLINRVNEEWLRNPGLTEAMTRAFVFADASAAAELDHAATSSKACWPRAMSSGEPTEEQHAIARVNCDVWLSNLTAWLTQRVSTAEVCRRLDHAMRLLIGDDEHPKIRIGLR